MGYYSGVRNNEISSFATSWIELESIVLSEISQKEMNEYCRTSLMTTTQVPNMTYSGRALQSHARNLRLKSLMFERK